MNNKQGYTQKGTEESEIDNLVIDRIEILEARITQLETTLTNALTFETLAARLIGNPETKKVSKPRTKREWTAEEKAAFHAKMVAGRLAKQKARQPANKK